MSAYFNHGEHREHGVRSILPALAAFLILVFLPGCSLKPTPADKLVVAQSSEPRTLDPQSYDSFLAHLCSLRCLL